METTRVIPTDTKGRFCSLKSLKSMRILSKKFDQWSEMKVTKVLEVPVLSSSHNASNFELWNERKATQHCGFCVTNVIALNQVRVYHERVYADNVWNVWQNLV